MNFRSNAFKVPNLYKSSGNTWYATIAPATVWLPKIFANSSVLFCARVHERKFSMALSVGANKVSTVFPRLSSPPFKAAEMRGSFSTTEASLDRPGRVLMISVNERKC